MESTPTLWGGKIDAAPIRGVGLTPTLWQGWSQHIPCEVKQVYEALVMESLPPLHKSMHWTEENIPHSTLRNGGCHWN